MARWELRRQAGSCLARSRRCRNGSRKQCRHLQAMLRLSGWCRRTGAMSLAQYETVGQNRKAHCASSLEQSAAVIIYARVL